MLHPQVVFVSCARDAGKKAEGSSLSPQKLIFAETMKPNAYHFVELWTYFHDGKHGVDSRGNQVPGSLLTKILTKSSLNDISPGVLAIKRV